MAEKITPLEKDYSQWYNDIIKASGLAEHSAVKGCMLIKPHGYAIWEKIQRELDDRFKQTGHQNAYFPLFVPKSFLSREARHVEGFAKEAAVVTHYRLKANEAGTDVEVDPEAKLDEEYIVRPTSETIIWHSYKDWIQSYRDLPLLINQWANVVRWEMRTRLFLRTSEFLWQEGHTAHEDDESAEEEVMQRLEQYREMMEEEFAIPSILGYKPEHDKFPGAKYTTTIETLMPDGKSIQSGTSHNLGQHFAKAFDVTFEDEEGEKQTAYTTSWGLSTRTIGTLVLAHGDNNGLVLPPRIAPYQVVVVPIYQEDNKEEVMKYSEQVSSELEEEFRVELDDRDHRTPGFKFNEWELKGVPLRIEVGPNEMEEESVTAVRRDNGNKKSLSLEKVGKDVDEELDDIQDSLYSGLEDYLQENIREAESKNEILATIGKNRGYVKIQWCGKEECETEIKDEVAAEIVVLPFDEDSEPERIQDESEYIEEECAVCGEEAKRWAFFAKNY